MADTNNRCTKEDEKKRFEYLDHPADVQIHSWGPDFKNALEAALLAMFNYMTDLDKIEEKYDMFYTAKGRDLETLIFATLDEALNTFQSEPFFIAKSVKITSFDEKTFEVKFCGWGDSFDLSKHPQEADIKAITYSNMQVLQKEDRCDIYVIVDI
ncbi:unnamed protein product [Caenorhabditis auriculariae]|uniref:Protein archease-like n=1 Tax=Caenorhabditis auriculariae TaxID=2777116 RepID=A0A8S1GUF4_9PELO|nr:unnamed protein product [Caenorhabditis auriculariae]